MDRNDNFIDDFLNLIDQTQDNWNTNNTNSSSSRLRKPYSPSSGTVVHSRYEYMKLILNTIQYNTGLGESYVNSYRSVIQFYQDKVEVHKSDLNYLENGIRKDIVKFKDEYNQTRKRTTLGKIDALEMVLNELLYSKHQLMGTIQNLI